MSEEAGKASVLSAGSFLNQAFTVLLPESCLAGCGTLFPTHHCC